MNIVKINLILINLFFLFFFNNILKSESNFYIVTKVDNEIITNVDIVHEANYMIALNNDLKKIDEKSLVNLARESLVREKIKKIEILKNESSLTVKDEILEGIIQNYYKKLKLESLSEFKDYLARYNLKLQDIKEKLIIEILWNKRVYYNYKNLLNINVEKLKKQVEDNKDNNNEIIKYLLSEILFSIESKDNFEKKNNEIREKIEKNGFKTAANIYSISSTANFGGRIGLVAENRLSKKIINEIKSIEKGQVTKTIDVANGFLILKLEDIVIEKFDKDLKTELDNLIRFETDKQLNQFSIIYFNKLKLNSKISHE
tara:strand:- start:134 stop:1081 length:948 start_codon:yes stop_codon:yes gene_type:complete